MCCTESPTFISANCCGPGIVGCDVPLPQGLNYVRRVGHQERRWFPARSAKQALGKLDLLYVGHCAAKRWRIGSFPDRGCVLSFRLLRMLKQALALHHSQVRRSPQCRSSKGTFPSRTASISLSASEASPHSASADRTGRGARRWVAESTTTALALEKVQHGGPPKKPCTYPWKICESQNPRVSGSAKFPYLLSMTISKDTT